MGNEISASTALNTTPPGAAAVGNEICAIPTAVGNDISPAVGTRPPRATAVGNDISACTTVGTIRPRATAVDNERAFL